VQTSAFGRLSPQCAVRAVSSFNVMPVGDPRGGGPNPISGNVGGASPDCLWSLVQSLPCQVRVEWD
jgi:hypothetical protein